MVRSESAKIIVDSEVTYKELQGLLSENHRNRSSVTVRVVVAEPASFEEVKRGQVTFLVLLLLFRGFFRAAFRSHCRFEI